MTQRSIPGRLDMSALAQLHGNATQHRPQSRPEYQREAARLARTGLTPHDIASILQLTPAGVRELLRGTP